MIAVVFVDRCTVPSLASVTGKHTVPTVEGALVPVSPAPIDVTVIRLGHRPGRDDRMTTHVGLTARALGARTVVLPSNANHAIETVRDVTDRFGGPFEAIGVADPRQWLSDWDGPIAHLTMYGLPVTDEIGAIRSTTAEELAVVVGGGKVGGDVFELATWNVAITNQPHSEVGSLAVFLDRLLDGAGTGHDWKGAQARVVPQSVGKRIERHDGE